MYRYVGRHKMYYGLWRIIQETKTILSQNSHNISKGVVYQIYLI